MRRGQLEHRVRDFENSPRTSVANYALSEIKGEFPARMARRDFRAASASGK